MLTILIIMSFKTLQRKSGDYMRLAIFDFDGTLYKKETFQLLMNHLKTHPTYHPQYKRFFRNILPLYIGYKLNLYPEHSLKERSMQLYINAFERLSTKELHAYFSEVANKMIDDINDDVIKRVTQHNKDKFYVMLVSGAFTYLLHAVTERILVSFDTIIGTDIPIKNDRLDKSTSIYHIQGIRKCEKIREYFKNQHVDWQNSFAYGDSLSDRSVLELVGNPVVVQPEPKLQKLAVEKGWEMI